MALIIETGSIVPNANSFVTRAEFIAHALEKGVTIADEGATDVMLVKAGQYINSKEPNLKGRLVNRDQPMVYPRNDLQLEGWAWSSTEIPRQVILAQMELALDLNDGIDLYNPPANPNLTAKRERIEGAVEVEYFGQDGGFKVSRDSLSQAIMSVLLKRNGLTIAMERAYG